MNGPPAAVAARNIGFSYRETPVFRGIDFTVAPGEMVALIGPNGSGKTTLLKLISGAVAPTGGGVTLSGKPIERLSSGRKARLVAVVPQETGMTFDFTVMETVLMGRTAYLGRFGVETHEDIAVAQEAMRRTGTLQFAGRLLSHLSGGERQLVVIARALAQKARLLLLDEPTAFLDIKHRMEIYDLLLGLNAEEGLTIVTTSHDINLAARYCRRIVLIKQGLIRADGPPDQVFQPELLSDVYDTPLHVMTDPATGIPYALPPIVPTAPAVSRGGFPHPKTIR